MRALRGGLVVARQAFLGAFRGKRGIALIALAALPVLIAWLYVRFGVDVARAQFLITVLMGTYQFVVPFAGLFLGVAVLGDEIDGRTVTYLFTRPVPRPVIYLGRLAGATSGFSVVLVLSLLAAARIFGAEIELGSREVLGTLLVAVVGLFVYAALFAAMRAVIQRALFVGFLLGFIVEGVISKLPASGISQWSIWHHLAVIQVRLFEEQPYQLREVLGGISASETARDSLLVLGVLFAVSLAAGLWLVRSREVRVPAAVA